MRPAAQPVDLDEQRRLDALEAALAAEQRPADQAGDVGEQAPEQRMADRIEPADAEQGVGLEQAEAEQARRRGSGPSIQPERASAGSSRV